MLRAGIRISQYGAGGAVAIGSCAIAQFTYFQATYEPLPTPVGPTEGIEFFDQRKFKSLIEKGRESVCTRGEDLKQRVSLLGEYVELAKVRLRRTTDEEKKGTPALSASTTADSLPRRPLRILFIGDSLIAGVGCRGDAIMPRRIARALADEMGVSVEWRAFANVGADMEGLMATTLPQVDEFVASVVERNSGEDGSPSSLPVADVCVVMCGLNDWKRILRGDKSPDTFHRDLTTMVGELRDRLGPGCRVVFPALPLEWTTAFAEPLRSVVLGLAELWDAQKKRLADESRAPARFRLHKQECSSSVESEVDYVVIPSYRPPESQARPENQQAFTYSEHLARGLHLLASDGVHPNEVGYRLWGDHIAQTLSGILKRQQRSRKLEADSAPRTVPFMP